MPRGEQRGNRESKKPKQVKPKASEPSGFKTAPAAAGQSRVANAFPRKKS